MFRMMGLFVIVQATLLLTVSFFVLFAMRKIEAQGLKTFGYVITALLWLAALMLFSTGIYKISTGRPSLGCMMQEMMKGKMQHGMMGGDKPMMAPVKK